MGVKAVLGGLGVNLVKNEGQTGVGSFIRNNAGLVGGAIFKGNGSGQKAGAVVGTAVGGPIGGAIGNVAGNLLDKTLGSYFASFKQGGLRCLGKQAITTNDANRILNEANDRVNAVNGSDINSVADGLNYLSELAAYYRFLPSALRSKCSKQNAEHIARQMQSTLDEYLKHTGFKFKTETRHRADKKGPIAYTAYIPDGYNVGYGGDFVMTNEELPSGGITAGDVNGFAGSNIDISRYEHLLDPNLVSGNYAPVGEYNEATGEYDIAPVELVAQKRNNDDYWSGGASGSTGGVVWNVGASNKKTDDDLLRTIMLIGLGLMGYKIFIK